MNEIVISAAEFRCKAYEPIFQNIYNSYTGGEHYNEIATYGGGASGKSEHITREVEYWLPEFDNDEAVVVTYSPMHANNTMKRMTRVLDSHGITYKVVNKLSHSELHFANGNIVQLISAKAGSWEETQEKLKTFVTNTPNSLKFIFFEEFTAIMHLFKTYNTFINTTSRLFREMRPDSIIFYAWNPPRNRRHPIYDFLKYFDGLKVFTTMYDLPPKWQSAYDLKVAEHLRKTNPTAYRLTYLGEDVGEDGLAFIVDKGMLTELADHYTSYHYLTDEGTANASTFMLLGTTIDGQVHCISSYYHTSKVDGVRKAPSEYAKDFEDFESMHGIVFDTITTDGIYFAEQLRVQGYPTAESIHKYKDRAKSYKLLKDLNDEHNLKIVIHEDEDGSMAEINKSNMLLYEQLENALIEESTGSQGQRIEKVSKAAESSSEDQSQHFHLGDLLLYFCTRQQKNVIGGIWRRN